MSSETELVVPVSLPSIFYAKIHTLFQYTHTHTHIDMENFI